MTYSELKIIKDKLKQQSLDYRIYNIPFSRNNNDMNNDYLKWLEKEIEYYYIEALNFLKLPLISLNIGRYKSRISDWYGEYNPNYKIITVNINKYEDQFNHYSKKEGMNNKDFNISTLFHEIGHYYHHYFHNSHFSLFRKGYSPINLDDKKYNEQNVEKHANNIARILYKRLYKNV